jgi:hypothetical protein
MRECEFLSKLRVAHMELLHITKSVVELDGDLTSDLSVLNLVGNLPCSS